jgi:hypothetical protein
MDLSDVLKKHSRLPFERLRVARHLDDLKMASIQRGIVFIFAVWSGPAVIALQRLTQVLGSMDLAGVDLVVLDTDCLSAEAGIALWGANLGGGGETLWIRDGNTVARCLAYVAGSEMDIIRHTEDLLYGAAV